MTTIARVKNDRAERAALVALLRASNAGWSEVARDVAEAGSAVSVFRSRNDTAPTLFPIGDDDADLTRANDEIAQWEARGIAVHSVLDERYPAQLRDIHQVPPVVFTRGELDVDRRSVAVVGTRKASDRGRSIAAAVATALVANEITVVSGLAAGIDTAAHKAALAAGGRTVAVIGTGIDHYYPRENKSLQDEIAVRGLLLSQFWPEASPSQKSFPMRNAVMSGYATATVVVEANARSGAKMQARLALQHGRSVVMPRELLEHPWAREYAGFAGAYVVADTDELIEVVNTLIDESAVSMDSVRRLGDLVQL